MQSQRTKRNRQAYIFGVHPLRSSVTSALFLRTELHIRGTDLHLVILHAQCFEIDDRLTVEEEDTHRNIIREGVDFMIESLCLLIRYDTRCYFNVRSKADMSRLNLPHGDDN